MRCVIMQPTYLPWTGYFDLIDQSDVFVYLDTVQFEKQSWQQRNRVKTQQGTQWLTAPVFQHLQNRIADVRLNSNVSWQRKHWGTLDNAYRHAAFYPDFAPRLSPYYSAEACFLADLNIALTKEMCRFIGVEACFIRASELTNINGKREDLLVAICRELGADEYLSPAGSRDYLKDATPFLEADIELRFHEYIHPTYTQLHGEFVPQLSAVDLLMNAGTESLAIIRSGRRGGQKL